MSKLTKAEAEAFIEAYEYERECWTFRRRMDKSGYEAVRLPPDEPIPYERLSAMQLGADHDAAESAFDIMVFDKAIEAGLATMAGSSAEGEG